MTKENKEEICNCGLVREKLGYHKCLPKAPNESWEELEKLYFCEYKDIDEFMGDAKAIVKSFIEEKLKEQRMKWVAEMESMKKDMFERGVPVDGYYILLQDLIKNLTP